MKAPGNASSRSVPSTALMSVDEAGVGGKTVRDMARCCSEESGREDKSGGAL